MFKIVLKLLIDGIKALKLIVQKLSFVKLCQQKNKHKKIRKQREKFEVKYDAGFVADVIRM